MNKNKDVIGEDLACCLLRRRRSSILPSTKLAVSNSKVMKYSYSSMYLYDIPVCQFYGFSNLKSPGTIPTDVSVLSNGDRSISRLAHNHEICRIIIYSLP